MTFRNEYWFLSNMFPCPIKVGKHTFRCVESAFQACKAPDRAEEFEKLNGFEAKKLGRTVQLPKDWNEKRLGYMYQLLKIKFSNELLAEKLKKINQPIIEENSWNDTFWGVCNGVGKNALGVLIEKVKGELK